MTNAAQFWDRIARSYARRPVQNAKAYRETLDATRAHLSPHDKVLEIGCGTGSTALILAEHVAQITATDISAEMIAIANEKSAPENVRFLQAGAEAKVEGDTPLDAVLAFNTLHILDDPEAVIGRVFQALKPGGVFISKSACLRDMNIFIRVMIRAMQMVGKAPAVSSFTSPELHAMFTRTGFEIVESRTFAGAGKLPFIVARRPA